MPPILLSHYHWDHVQGLPFLPGLYHRNTAVRIWGPALDGVDERWAGALFRAPFFPVALDRLPSAPSVTVVDADELEIEGFQVRVQTLTHPGGSRAYRVAGATGDLVYVTDHEFGDPATDDALASFASGSAALVLDAHFTPDEIGANRGLGHSSWRQAAEFAACTGSARLYLFHHRPGRSDVELSDIEARASGVFAAASAAREGTGFDI